MKDEIYPKELLEKRLFIKDIRKKCAVRISNHCYWSIIEDKSNIILRVDFNDYSEEYARKLFASDFVIGLRELMPPCFSLTVDYDHYRNPSNKVSFNIYSNDELEEYIQRRFEGHAKNVSGRYENVDLIFDSKINMLNSYRGYDLRRRLAVGTQSVSARVGNLDHWTNTYAEKDIEKDSIWKDLARL